MDIFLAVCITFIVSVDVFLAICITFIYGAHGRGVYICGRPFRIPAHAELIGLFPLFTLFLEEFDYTSRVQHVLRTTGYS